uniref:Aquaporin n=1 Tax=Panagrellus redivivus TaxID=6233 RepID=A0A7E4V0X8_PANRE
MDTLHEYGKALHLVKFYPLFTAVIYYVFVFTVAEFIRREIEKTKIPQKHPYITRVVFEFIATMQMCACVYENGVILRNYGVPGFFVVVVLLLLSAGSWNRGAAVNPIPIIKEVHDNKIDLLLGGSLIAVQFAGAAASSYIAYGIWHVSYDYFLEHRHFYHKLPCAFNYHVPFLAVVAWEFFGNFLIYAIGARLGERKRYAMPVLVSLLLSIAFVYIGVPGLNPITTTGRMFNCKGLNDQWFIFTYCLIPLFAAYVATYFDPQPAPEAPPKPKKYKKQYWKPKGGKKNN